MTSQCLGQCPGCYPNVFLVLPQCYPALHAGVAGSVSRLLSQCYPGLIPGLSQSPCRSGWVNVQVVILVLSQSPCKSSRVSVRVVFPVLSRCYPVLWAGADGPFQPGAGPSCSVEHRGATPGPVNPLKERIIRSAPKTHLIPAAQPGPMAGPG